VALAAALAAVIARSTSAYPTAILRGHDADL
jgi:hypothetical protein